MQALSRIDPNHIGSMKPALQRYGSFVYRIHPSKTVEVRVFTFGREHLVEISYIRSTDLRCKGTNQRYGSKVRIKGTDQRYGLFRGQTVSHEEILRSYHVSTSSGPLGVLWKNMGQRE